MPTVTIKIADALTPLAEGGRSKTGHMWLSLKHENGEKLSYGFAPLLHGAPIWKGKVYRNDDSNYLSVYHQQTFVISNQEYKSLKEFANNPNKHGFNIYEALSNSCIDFTWKALNQIGIKPESTKDKEGKVWPASNNTLVDESYHNYYSSPAFNHELRSRKNLIKSEKEIDANSLEQSQPKLHIEKTFYADKNNFGISPAIEEKLAKLEQQQASILVKSQII